MASRSWIRVSRPSSCPTRRWRSSARAIAGWRARCGSRTRNACCVSDVPNDRILRWTESGGVSVFRQPSGLRQRPHPRPRKAPARLLAPYRCITRTELDGTVTVLADRYQGKRLNSPERHRLQERRHDLVQRSDLRHQHRLRRRQAASRSCRRRSIGSTLATASCRRRRRFRRAERPVLLARREPGSTSPRPGTSSRPTASGTSASSTWRRRPASRKAARVFHKVTPGFADGFRADEEGNIWSSAGDGVHCISPAGAAARQDARFPAPVSNLCFGGRNRSRLFVCASHTLYAIYINARGARRP